MNRSKQREFEQKVAKEAKFLSKSISASNVRFRSRVSAAMGAAWLKKGSKPYRSKQREFEQKVAKEAKFLSRVFRRAMFASAVGFQRRWVSLP